MGEGGIVWGMGAVKRFEDFEIWQTAREITRRIYALTRQKEFSRDFGLVGQIQRASVSIMNNFAEGYESQTKNVFIRHLRIAKGSAGEVRSLLYVTLDQRYVTKSEFEPLLELIQKTSRQLSALITYLSGREK